MDEVDKVVEGGAVFIPSHLTKALLATGVAIFAGAISIGAGAYARHEFRRVTTEEIAAMVTGGDV